MTSSEKFCLKWNDFQENIVSSFHGLREDLDFSDVTLACEENKQIEAHRVILSACSPFFRSVLRMNKHSHPMIYMRGLKSKDLVAIVDFIYHGEANIYQEDLDGFLALAEELQLKGLTRQNEDQSLEQKKDNLGHSQLPKPKKKPPTKHKHISARNAALIENVDNFNEFIYEDQQLVPIDSDKTVVKIDLNNETLLAKIATMMERTNEGEGTKWRCTVCGKLGRYQSEIARHVECHIEGVSHPCNLCGKVSRSSNAHQSHVSKYHCK